ncbi:MAG: protein kinase domain-containing protein [Solirubrobacteraceae bacterium]
MSTTPLGTLLGGRYRLEERIGSGGMSTVYRAFDTVLERSVAIKLMHRESASDSDQLERFRREARAVAQLSHPHIVTVIDAGDEDGTPYIVLEYVEGETLKAHIRREGPMDIPQAVAYTIEIARALGAAHERQIVHRDVKPQNVLLSVEGQAKITDFGIARTLTEQGLTADGRVLGTTDYVSPEQALGQAVTGQSDIYSLGVVLYEMLSGEVPFTAETPVAVAMKQVREEIPDVQVFRPEVSAATAAVVERATAKDLQRRYPNIASMIGDLEDVLAIETARSGHAASEVTSVLRTLPGPARRRVPWRLRYRSRWLALLALLAVIIAVVLVLAAGHAHRGTGRPSNEASPPHLSPVSLGQESAHDYNPFGNIPEHPDEVSNAVDGDPNTSWSTEHYQGGNLGKPGVGLYVDATPGLAARAITIQTPTPGFYAAIYATSAFDQNLPFGDSEPLTQRGWHLLAAPQSIGSQTTIDLNTAGQRYRYYLVWITKLQPESAAAAVAAQISEVTLFR